MNLANRVEFKCYSHNKELLFLHAFIEGNEIVYMDVPYFGVDKSSGKLFEMIVRGLLNIKYYEIDEKGKMIMENKTFKIDSSDALANVQKSQSKLGQSLIRNIKPDQT